MQRTALAARGEFDLQLILAVCMHMVNPVVIHVLQVSLGAILSLDDFAHRGEVVLLGNFGARKGVHLVRPATAVGSPAPAVAERGAVPGGARAGGGVSVRGVRVGPSDLAPAAGGGVP